MSKNVLSKRTLNKKILNKKILSLAGICLLAAVFSALLTAGQSNSAPGSNDSKESNGGAKDLFYRQVSDPGKVLNTGMQYWIELKRDKKITRVSNKFSFKSGDSIRIHVTSNTDAYAYIVLKEGSRGEQSILFPDPRFKDNNKLKASVDYAIPQDGALTFDKNPGTENLILLLSRNPIDAHAYLADKKQKHVRIAAVRDGAKDLIPGSVVLAYANQDGSIGNLPESESNKTEPQETGPSRNKPQNTVLASDSTKNDAVTTLVQKDPTQVLAIDLSLLHSP